MKKIILATVAFSLIATPAAFAQHYGGPQPKHSEQNWKGKPGAQSHKHGSNYRKEAPRRWSKGQRLDSRYRRQVVHERDYRRYRLHQPPRGYQWVRVDNDFILVSVATGVISSIIGAAIANSY